MSNTDTAGHGLDERLTAQGRNMLQVIYDLLRERGAWPTFRTIDLNFDRRLHIADAQAALASLPDGYLQRPWRGFGFSDNDEVRLSPEGIQECDGGPEDLELTVRLIRWLCEVEQSQGLDDESDLTVESVDFASTIGLDVQPDRSESTVQAQAGEPQAPLSVDTEDEQSKQSENPETLPPSAEALRNRNTLVRLRLISELLPRFWSGAGWHEPWRWRYTIDRRGLRPYRDIRGVNQLLEYAERVREESGRARAVIHNTYIIDNSTYGVASEPESNVESASSDEIDVLLTILRPEIVESAGAQLRGGLYDDAVFAAYRRVESTVQERSGLTASIGDTLIKQAFKETSAPIKVSGRAQDADRLIQLFGGAIGLYKGDRSHKDKPALPCRSLRECLRQLANASALLDLLDRDLAVSPAVRGYDHRGDTLELWVDRASAQSQVWLDDRICDVVRHGPGGLIVDVTGIPTGEHELFIIDGNRTGPVTQVWLTKGLGEAEWQRVEEINIPLFSGPTGPDRLSVTGLRLATLENGIRSQRLLPTADTYRVGDYVRSDFKLGPASGDPSAIGGIGPCWAADADGQDRRLLWDSHPLFDGEPYSPEHEPRLTNITLEPPALVLHRGEKSPVRALGHYTDGVATWSDPLVVDGIRSDDSKIAHVQSGTVFAKEYGKTTLRLLHEGIYATSSVHIAAHPIGAIVDVLTGLPSVCGLASVGDRILVSTRTDELWEINSAGQYKRIAVIPPQPPAFGGIEKIAAAESGDVALLLYGHQDALVLYKASDFNKSRWIKPEEGASITAISWDHDDLIAALNSGLIVRMHPSGRREEITRLSGKAILSITLSDSSLLALTRDRTIELWKVSFSADNAPAEVTRVCDGLMPGSVESVNGSTYLTEFDGGRVLLLDGPELVEIAMGLHNPGELTGALDGSIYIAESGRGAVRRILP